MQFLLDHSLAVVCSAAIIIAALTLQTRSRVHNVQEVVSNSARTKVDEFADVLTQDLDNTLSEMQAWELTGTYRCRLEQDPSGSHTTLVEVPSFVASGAAGVPVPGHIRYTLVATGDSVRVADGWARTHTLMREVDSGAGYSTPGPVATDLVDFDVTFRGRASTSTAGTPPLRFTQIAFELATGLREVQTGSTFLNVARTGVTVRPPNLVSRT